MKAKKREAMATFIEEAVRAEFARQSMAQGFHTLTIRFENRAVSVPYQPWHPREDIALPGRWVQDDDLPDVVQ